MKIFQHKLWGYEITLPDTWQHIAFNGKDGFAEEPEAFQESYEGEKLGHLLIQGEWNALQKPVEKIWKGHISKTAMMLGAKKIGAAPWRMAGRSGLEVEIVLPKKSKKRLWAGILEHGMLVLSFMVLHWKTNRESFEPVVTEVISSLRFPPGVDGLSSTAEGIPLPPQVSPADPAAMVDDIQEPERWQGFTTPHGIGPLQAFYTRELPNDEWEMLQYIPFPNTGGHPFAQIKAQKEKHISLIGLLPSQETIPSGRIIIKELE
jgi:hypothetical protein